MNEKNIDSTNSRGFSDNILWCIVWGIVALGVYGNYYFNGYSSFIRVISLCFMGIAAISAAYFTQKGKAVAALIIGAKSEVEKVVWPNRQEIIQTTIIVVAAVVIVGIMLWGIDSLLGWSVKKMVR